MQEIGTITSLSHSEMQALHSQFEPEDFKNEVVILTLVSV